MAETIGTVGGVMMIALIVLFAMILGAQTKALPLSPDRARELWLRLITRTGLCAALVMAAWIVCTVCRGSHNPFDYAEIWTRLPVGEDCADLTAAAFAELLHRGCLPLTTALYNGFGRLLLNAHGHAQITLGLLSAGAALLMADEAEPHGSAWLLCFPGAVLLLLPGPCSLFCALFLASTLCRAHKNRAWQLTFAALCCLSHPFGAGVLLAALLEPLTKKAWLSHLIIAAAAAACAILLPTRAWDLLPLAAILLLKPGCMLMNRKYGAGIAAVLATVSAVWMLVMMGA